MTKLKKLHLTLVALLILASLLAACGDSTTTTAPTTAASTTAAISNTAGSAISTTAAISNTAGSAISTTVATAATKTAAIITTTTTATSAVPGEIYDAGGISYLDPRPNYQKAPAGNKGGNLNLAAASDAKSLHPYLTTDATSTDWQGFIYSGSFYDVDLKSGTPTVNFRVADALKVSADKLTYTFTLKDGLKWSDGKPITSADYEWTYKQALDPANNYPYVKDFTDVLESVTAPDAKTVVFKLKVADLYGIAKTGLVPLPKHIWEGKNWGDATQNAEINSPTVVSGPWKLKEWKRGQYITFVRNDNSTIWPVPQLESVTVQIVSSRTVQVQKLKAGELDAIDLNATEYDEAKKATNASVLEYFSFQASWSFIGFNFRRSYLQDLELRKALAYATPQKDIVDKLVLGLGQAIYSSVPQSSGLYNPQTPKYEYNIEKAKSTLTAAGYKVEGGKLKDKAGNEIPKLKILFNSDNKVREGIATVVQQSYKELGIELEIVPLEFQTYLEKLQKDPFDYDFYVLGWRSTVTPETFDQVWKGGPSLNMGAWDTAVSKQVLDLYSKANQEFDVAKRKEIMGQIQVLTAQDLPYVFIYQAKNLSGISNKLVTSPTTGLGVSYNVYTDWSLK